MDTEATVDASVELATECAAAQGSFRAFYDSAFRNRAMFAGSDWRAIADIAAVPDMAELDACVRNRLYSETIAREYDVARRLGIDGVPTTILHRRGVVGALSLSALDSIIGNELSVMSSRH